MSSLSGNRVAASKFCCQLRQGGVDSLISDFEADKGLVLDRSIKASQCVNVVTADGDCLVAGAKRNRVDRRGIRLSRLLEWHSHYLLLQFSS